MPFTRHGGRIRKGSQIRALFCSLPEHEIREARKKVARFRQINMGKPSVHHDALEFPDGETVLLTRLCEGQHATVLQLPASPRPVSVAEGQKRDSLVR